ncbi:MAG: LemA family protein [Spirochaetales bacterium]|nr:LemA family protein [Spirochaetales bacterium]
MSKKRAAGIAVPLLIVVVIIVILFSWFIRTRNSIIVIDEEVNAAWSEVGNQLQRRSDLIPNLVETVKGFAGQEQEVFSAIADARARLAGAGSVQETAEGYTELNSALSRLMVIVENYPELKSNENFIRLQDELAGTENRIAVARKRYNDSVRVFNTKIRVFPGSIVANRAGFEARDYFEVPEEAMTVPKVQF